MTPERFARNHLMNQYKSPIFLDGRRRNWTITTPFDPWMTENRISSLFIMFLSVGVVFPIPPMMDFQTLQPAWRVQSPKIRIEMYQSLQRKERAFQDTEWSQGNIHHLILNRSLVLSFFWISQILHFFLHFLTFYFQLYFLATLDLRSPIQDQPRILVKLSESSTLAVHPPEKATVLRVFAFQRWMCLIISW